MKTFEKGRSVTAESVFTVITKHVDQSILDKVYSVMSDTMALAQVIYTMAMAQVKYLV